MQPLKVIPVLRVLDQNKTLEFYVGWLGFSLEWQHEPDPAVPAYMEISLNDIVLHLSESYGDCPAAAKVFIECTGLEKWHKQISVKGYQNSHPELIKAAWGNTLTMELYDPAGNKLLFCQNIDHE